MKEQFGIAIAVRDRVASCSLGFFNVYMDAVMKWVKMGMGRKRVRFLEDGRVEIAWLLVWMTWFYVVSAVKWTYLVG